MLRFSNTHLAIVFGIIAAAMVLAMPNLFSRQTVENWPGWLPQGQINLGLDLQGGSHLLLEVEAGAVIQERLQSMVDEVRLALRTNDIRYRGLGVRGGAVQFSLVDPAQREAALAQLQELNPTLGSAGLGGGMLGGGGMFGGGGGFSPGQNLYEVSVTEDGQARMALTEEGRSQLVSNAVRQSLEVVRRRIDELGTREPTIQRQGESRILVQVPGERDPGRIRDLLGTTARLTFHMVNLQVSPREVRSGEAPPGLMVLPSAETNEQGEPQRQWVVRERVLLSGENLVDAQATTQQNQPVVSFRFDSEGARRFGEITSNNVGQLFAIVLDGEVISAPRIQEPILGGQGVISGNFTFQSANDLAVLLRAGALPAPLTILEERSVGPGLGADSIAAGKAAGVVAMVLVCVFMIAAYGIFGIAAVMALGVNLVLIAAALSFLGATLTLPGIAGIVLTIGMAVDANVLIFERIREEMRTGKGAIGAIDGGFRMAIGTIVDANVTTLIAAVLLFQFGSGPIRGFAVTLSIGVLASMFSAITFTRVLIGLWYQRTRPKALPI